MEIPIVGGAYEGYSRNINAQRCINLFAAVDQQQAKNQVALYGTPGLVEFCDLEADEEVRGMHVFGDYIYVVINNQVYYVSSNGTKTSLGEIVYGASDIFMADNGTEVIIVNGTNGYIIDSNVLSVIADEDFPAASSVTFQDGYFIVTETGTGKFFISGLYDGTTWSALDFATAEASPDNNLRVISNTHDLWIFGERTAEVYYNSGNTDFPFERISGAVLELGMESASSAVKILQTIYWLSADKQVVRTHGYQFEVVSTSQIDYQISTYSTTNDARGYTYQMLGHIFYVLAFPTEKKTWVYDIATGFWHEWQSYYTDGGPTELWSRHRSNCIVKFNDKYIAGDYGNGKLYELDIDTYTDDTEEIQRIRTTSVVSNEMRYLLWDSLHIDFETGVGDGLGGQGDDPTVCLEWSDDNGGNWSNEHWTALGQIGEYSTRAIWRRLGKSRNRIYRVTVTDPVKVVILGGYANVRECAA